MYTDSPARCSVDRTTDCREDYRRTHMDRMIKKLILIFTVISVVAGAAYCITRFLLASGEQDDPDYEEGRSLRHDNTVKRHYTRLNIPRD